MAKRKAKLTKPLLVRLSSGERELLRRRAREEQRSSAAHVRVLIARDAAAERLAA